MMVPGQSGAADRTHPLIQESDSVQTGKGGIHGSVPYRDTRTNVDSRLHGGLIKMLFGMVSMVRCQSS